MITGGYNVEVEGSSFWWGFLTGFPGGCHFWQPVVRAVAAFSSWWHFRFSKCMAPTVETDIDKIVKFYRQLKVAAILYALFLLSGNVWLVSPRCHIYASVTGSALIRVMACRLFWLQDTTRAKVDLSSIEPEGMVYEFESKYKRFLH